MTTSVFCEPFGRQPPKALAVHPDCVDGACIPVQVGIAIEREALTVGRPRRTRSAGLRVVGWCERSLLRAVLIHDPECAVSVKREPCAVRDQTGGARSLGTAGPSSGGNQSHRDYREHRAAIRSVRQKAIFPASGVAADCAPLVVTQMETELHTAATTRASLPFTRGTYPNVRFVTNRPSLRSSVQHGPS